MPEREKWQLELADSTRSIEELKALLPNQDTDILRKVISGMRFSITPHQRSLIDFSDKNDPLLRMCLPHEQELFIAPEEVVDPIGDELHMLIPFLTHRYKDRALIHATFNCAGYCRFCFRKYKTGQATPGPTQEERKRIYTYFENHSEICEAILSGGDPLIVTDNLLDEWVSELGSIPSIKRIRIHTRALVNLPSRFTDNLVNLLRSHIRPDLSISMVTHFNHPNEIAPENKQAIAKLIGAGIDVRNQNVLLKGINDDRKILKKLFKQLVENGITPYYIHQLDLAKGTNHFRVPLETGMRLVSQLQSEMPNFPLPRYMLDVPGGLGKIEITSKSVKKQADQWLVQTRFGDWVEYNEPKHE